MPIANCYLKSGAPLFAAASHGAHVPHKNNNPGVDADTENVAGGLCSGITSAWVAAVLCAPADASAVTPQDFEHCFDNLLRFQGAYLKELHGKADTHLAVLRKHLPFDYVLHGALACAPLTAASLPAQAHWAAYMSLGGHAIGIGRYNGQWMIMDPNCGLFCYAHDQAAAWLADINHLADSYHQRKGRPAGSTVSLQVFLPG